MARGPYSRIVIRRSDGSVEVIGRGGHLEPGRVSRDLARFGQVLAVRHQQGSDGGTSETVAVHELAPGVPVIRRRKS